jgi:hypothetical protein
LVSRKTLFILGSIFSILAVIDVYMALDMWNGDEDLDGLSIALYESPQCECRTRYAGYLSSLGAEVSVANVGDIDALMERLGIPMELRSCHVSIVEGYVVVGHVPADVIKKLLSERPNIKGISLPGMPGTKEKPFVIYSLANLAF